ncbi:hypothetical protein TruAng_006048 [Truncatella angustata]|nr:hypothetical protein TruAng_006048 [Truncatella angustata]
MSSSLVWLPPKRYDSIKSIWQDQYIWSPLPVDNSIPLDQTSFLDISKDDAEVARSRSNTLRSRASTGCIRQVQDGEEAQDLVARAQPYSEEEISYAEAIPCKDNPRRHGVKGTPSTIAPRPSALSSNRLRSFHLPGRIQAERVSPKAESRPGEQGHKVSPLQEIVVADEKPSQILDPPIAPIVGRAQSTVGLPSMHHESHFITLGNAVEQPAEETRQGTQAQQRRPLPKMREPQYKSAGKEQSKVRTVTKPSNDSLRRKPSQRTSQSKRTSLRLSLNLDVEVQLKVSLYGDLTLTLLN